MQSGRLKHRIRLERKALDHAGERGGKWEPASPRPVAADIVFLRAGEEVLGQRLQGKRPAIITVRADGLTRQVDNSWRCIDARKGTIFNIQGVSPNRADDQLDIIALAGGADG